MKKKITLIALVAILFSLSSCYHATTCATYAKQEVKQTDNNN